MAHTILGILMEAPSHGYSIKRYLSDHLAEGVQINDGQLYPTLARLEQRGWITKEVVEQRRSPNKHLYRLTPEGRGAFFRWLEGADDETPTAMDYFWRSSLLQKCNFFHHLEPRAVRAQVREKLDEVSRSEAALKNVLEDLERRDTDPYRRMILDYGIRYQQMRREWLHELLARAADPAQRASGG